MSSAFGIFNNCNAELLRLAVKPECVKVASGRSPQGRLGVALDHKPRPGAIKPGVIERLKRIHDTPDTRLAQWQIVRIAVHETQPAPVRANLRQVACKKSISGMQNLKAGKVAAHANQRTRGIERVSLAVPEMDR